MENKLKLEFLLLWFCIVLLERVEGVLRKEKVVLAINCGSMRKDFTDEASGVTYAKDIYYSGGEISDAGAQYTNWIEFTDINVYLSERYSLGEDLVYRLPLTEPGKYVLILKFSEVYFNVPKQKQFRIGIGSNVLIDDFDIFEKVGKYSPYDEYISFDFHKDTIKVNGKEMYNGYNKKRKEMELRLGHIRNKDNPKINGILLIKGTLEDTNSKEFDAYYQSLVEQKEEQKQSEWKRQIALLEDSKEFDLSDFGVSYLEYEKLQSNPFSKTVVYQLMNLFLETNFLLELSCLSIVVLFFMAISKIGNPIVRKKSHDRR